jgi:DNA-binding transcriptional LysR family regulator
MTYLERVDLNLLGPLAALLDERHVSRAADRVGISQPAMSQALSRLRHLLGDELLVRGPGGYRLTPRAERLQGKLTAVLPRLEVLFAREAFDPARAAEAFRLAGTDYPVLVFGGALSRQVLRESPHSTLRFGTWHDQVFDDLDRGVTDLGFYGSLPPAGLRSELLFEERFVCVLDAGHPLAGPGPRMTLADYLGCAHLVVEVVDGDQAVIDRYLQGLGTPRTASLTVPYHAAAPGLVPGTSLVATIPARLAARHTGDPGIAVVPAPLEVQDMSYQMVWHPRLDGDPAQRWLRDTIRAVTATLGP